MTIDDSALFHASRYDPVKARAYYLRTRKLKGRRPTTATPTSPGRGGRKPSSVINNRPGVKPNRADTKSRRAELKAQQEALKKRLERLEVVLSDLVKAAKKKSGGDPNKQDDSKDKAPETKKDKADRNEAEKKDKPETASEKKERAKKAKETYEKEHPNTLSQDVEILKAQVEDIQAKIRKAVADARERRNRADGNTRPELQNDSGGKTRSDMVLPNPKIKSNDGPRGR